MAKDPNQLKIGDVTLQNAVDNIVSEEQEEGPAVEISEQKEFFKVPARFGSVPVDELPLGYTKGKEYRDKFPRVNLPLQKIEEIKFDNPDLEPDKLYWGDNLHIMRSLPSESIDLIYIDPPFFSGRKYNVIFGDENEVRSFSDIWDGGMPTYLIWLNVRLLEMKRLLKSTGSIYVHLDWHASHYIKVEMDKIFGYDNFRNEIIWSYEGSGLGTVRSTSYPSKHDVILWYNKGKEYTYNPQLRDYKPEYKKLYRQDEKGLFREKWRYHTDKTGYKVKQYMKEGVPFSDTWQIESLTGPKPERMGYPTQKPEELIERIIKTSTNPNDTVADFFMGGGTTPAVAQRLGRRWIASDISRIAVEITKGRILKMLKGEGQGWIVPENTPNIQLLSWGYYDIPSLSSLSEDEFKIFIIKAFGARKISDPVASGLKDGVPVWIGPKDHDESISDDNVLEFAQYLNDKYETRKKGIMVGWQFSDKAKQAKEMLARLGAGIEFVTIDLVNIGSEAFREHVTSKHTEYDTFLRFIMPPVVRLKIKRRQDMEYEFDFSESASLNNGKIINIQADFDYEKVFVPTSGYAFLSKGNSSSPLLLSYKFNSSGKKTVAFRVEDDQGGEALQIKELEVE